MNPNIFEANLSRVVEILEFLRTHKIPESEAPPELKQALDSILEQITIIKKANAEIAKLNDTDTESMLLNVLTSSDVSGKEKRDIIRASTIARDAKSFKEAIEKVQSKGAKPKNDKTKGDDETRQKSKERQKRFKPLGSDKGWIPM